MAQNKKKQMNRLQGKAKPKIRGTKNASFQNHPTLNGNIAGQRNRIGTRKTGETPRFK